LDPFSAPPKQVSLSQTSDAEIEKEMKDSTHNTNDL